MAKPICPICEKPVGWRKRTLIHPDYYFFEGSCEGCLRMYDLLTMNGPKASYHASCLDNLLEARPSRTAIKEPGGGELHGKHA